MVIAKAMERIGDHAKTIAEFVYVVRCTDERRVSATQFEQEASNWAHARRKALAYRGRLDTQSVTRPRHWLSAAGSNVSE
ncbi:hypothetical protein [Paraburkholderia sp.]|jgi:hypothetical protein|uniref:hypothetical protein n=1 Tax=Paraburkholderia sp. TaxID=1926495 RepID=UPI0039C8C72E